jgi:hypothetical protein
LADPILDCGGTNEITLYNSVIEESWAGRWDLSSGVFPGADYIDSASIQSMGKAPRSWIVICGPITYSAKYHLEQMGNAMSPVKLASAPITYDSGGAASTVKVVVAGFGLRFMEVAGTRVLGAQITLVEVT